MGNAWLLTLPLGLIWFLWFLVSFVFSLLLTLIKQIGRCCHDAPDASSVIELEREATEEKPLISGARVPVPVPIGHAYTGDMVHYFGYLKNTWLAMQDLVNKTGSRVFTYNMGKPSVACLDVPSAELILSGVDVRRHKHIISDNFNTDYTGGQCPNFISNGDTAEKTRQFFLALTPTSLDDKLFVEGVERLKLDLKTFVQASSGSSTLTELTNCVQDLIASSISTMFLGAPIDLEILKKMSPVPMVTPQHPSLPPKCLFPLHWRASGASAELFAAMRQKPNWLKVSEAARAANISEDQACGNIVCAITFNAASYISPMTNAFIILDKLPKKGFQLLVDELLLESLAWELLRNTGPGVGYTTPWDTNIPTSRQGVTHRVKAGTMLYAHLGFAQRDCAVWNNADTFKADRFMPMPPRTLKRPKLGYEPLPTIAFGCPLGFMDDQRQKTRSHQCVFTQMAQPYMVAFLKVLIAGFKWRVIGVELTKKSDYEFDFSAARLKGGSSGDMIPKTHETAKIIWQGFNEPVSIK